MQVNLFLSTRITRYLNKIVDRSLPDIANFVSSIGDAVSIEFPDVGVLLRRRITDCRNGKNRRWRGQGYANIFAMRANKFVGLRLI